MVVRAIGLALEGRVRAEIPDLVQRVVATGNTIAIVGVGQLGGAVLEPCHLLGHVPDAFELFLQEVFRHGRRSRLLPVFQPITCQIAGSAITDESDPKDEILRGQW
jgi:hypothetical protein